MCPYQYQYHYCFYTLTHDHHRRTPTQICCQDPLVLAFTCCVALAKRSSRIDRWKVLSSSSSAYFSSSPTPSTTLTDGGEEVGDSASASCRRVMASKHFLRLEYCSQPLNG